jgi:hypothetical protein
MTVATKKRKAAKPSVRTSKTDIGAQEIFRTWGDVEVIDSDDDLFVTIAPEDLKKATKKDPACCVFAQACKRTFGATKVLFLRTTAYVELPNKKGIQQVKRFEMPAEMRELVEAFDRGESTIPKAGFTLKAPPPSHRLDSLLKKSNTRHAHARAAAKKRLINGQMERRGNQGLGAYQSRPITIDLVRNGTGTVHFKSRKADSAV